MGWLSKMKKSIRNFLEIEEANSNTIHIKSDIDHETETFINKIWYRGQAYELEQLYTQLGENELKSFWGSRGKLRKIHTGLPAMIIDTLVDIIINDLNAINVESRQEEWDQIEEENKFKETLRDALTDALHLGDGAFKLSVDPSLSNYPIIEFFAADRVDFEYRRGRLVEVIFKTKKTVKNREYTLLEHYSKEGIRYSLLNKTGNEVDIEILGEDLKPVKNNSNFIMATKFQLSPSSTHEGRGKSLFSGKLGNFDAYDEVWSQWMQSLRKGQIKEYIPESLLPRDLKSGMITKLRRL